MNNVRFIPNVPYFRIWANIFDYKSRTKRKDFFIDLFLSIVVLSILFYLCFKVTPWLLFAFFIHLIFPLIPLMVRRIRDTGNSPLWCLLLLIGELGILPLFIMCFLKSREDEKKGLTKGGTISIISGFVVTFVAIPVIVICILITGLSTSKDYSIEYDQKFKHLENNEQYVLFNYNGVSYMDKEYKYGSLDCEGSYDYTYILKDTMFYFVSDKKIEDKYYVYINKLDLVSGEITLIETFTYDDYTNTSSYGDVFYIQTYDENDDILLYAYDLNGDYYFVCNNVNCDTYVYQFKNSKIKYSIADISEERFAVTDLETLEQHIIDEDILKNNEAGKILYEYEYRSHNGYIYNDTIYLYYALDDSSFMSNNYYVIFEYDFENNSLSFMFTDTKTSDNIIKINH